MCIVSSGRSLRLEGALSRGILGDGVRVQPWAERLERLEKDV